VICPTRQDVFREIAHASDREATLHGVVFDIFGSTAAKHATDVKQGLGRAAWLSGLDPAKVLEKRGVG
jgi:hypothetical protein